MTEPIVKDLQTNGRAALENIKMELSGIRTNRPSSKLVENVKVMYMEQEFMLKQLGSISVVPPREIDVNVWDKDAVGAVCKAIETSGMGLTANTDGSLIRINLPALTDERRQELTKLVKSLTEQTKIRVRMLREDANKQVEAVFKAKTISEDQKFKGKENIQKEVDKLNGEIETALALKLKEISE